MIPHLHHVEQVQLPGIGDGAFLLTGQSGVVMIRIEFAEQHIEADSCIPDLGEFLAAGATALDASPTVNSGIVALMFGAAAGETAGTKFQHFID